MGIGASPFHGLPKLGLIWPQSPLMPLVIQLHPASPVSCMWKLGHLKKLSLPSSPLYVGFFIAALRLANSLSIISEKPCSPFPTVHKQMSLHLCPAVLMTTLSLSLWATLSPMPPPSFQCQGLAQLPRVY